MEAEFDKIRVPTKNWGTKKFTTEKYDTIRKSEEVKRLKVWILNKGTKFDGSNSKIKTGKWDFGWESAEIIKGSLKINRQLDR